MFIPHADFKFFIDCNIDERARRVLEHNREDENGDFEEIKLKMIQREESETKRFKQFYDYDYQDPNNYDLIIDSTNIPREEVMKKILDFINDFSG